MSQYLKASHLHEHHAVTLFPYMFQCFKKQKRIHLDYAATTPVCDEVYAAMRPYWNGVWANPSAVYKEGVEARTVIDSARTELARTLRVRAEDITFTSGGTESNNLALRGVVESLRNQGVEYADMEIITSRIEHPSILETIHYLEKQGVGIKYAQVDEDGNIVLQEFASLLSVKTVLVSIAYVNSEVGVIQDIKKIGRSIRAWNEKNNLNVLFHTDASQAPLWLPCALDALGVDLMTLDAGKCYGPKGSGVLVHRHRVTLASVTYGGGQERGLRPGTENTPLIIGCVRALVRAQEHWKSRSEVAASLRDAFNAMLEKNIEGVIVNGNRESRVANNVNISLPGIDTDYALMVLDAKGIAASTKSACDSEGDTGSRVVYEMTHDTARSISTLRFTLGEKTTHRDIEYATKILMEHIMSMKKCRLPKEV